MTQALGIGLSALEADTTVMSTLSENVANAQTPGYVDETAALAALPGSNGVGSGVEVTSIAQATNAMLATNNWQAQGVLADLGSRQQTLTAIEGIFPLAATAGVATSPNSVSATSSAGIAGELSTFFSAWDAVTQSPSSTAPKLQVIDDAKSLAVGFNEAATQLTEINTNALSSLGEQVTQVNNLLGQAASLNQAIVTTEGGGGNASQLQDQLNSIIGTLSSLAGVGVSMLSNGTATISVSGVTLVQGTTAATLSVHTDAGQRVVVATPGDVAVPVASGSIAGLLASVNRYIPQYETQLSSAAVSLKNAVNTQLSKGYFSTGAAASTPTHPSTPLTYALFVGTSASDLTLNAVVATNPGRLAVSSTPGAAAANNGGNAQAMAELATAPGGPQSLYQNLVQNIGADTQSVNSQQQAQTAVATQAHAALQAVTGVDVTAELTSLLSAQQDYQAAAKVIGIVHTTIESLLTAV